MFKIKPGYNTVLKSMRLPEPLIDEIEHLAKVNNMTFTSVAIQCLQYALGEMDDEDRYAYEAPTAE